MKPFWRIPTRRGEEAEQQSQELLPARSERSLDEDSAGLLEYLKTRDNVATINNKKRLFLNRRSRSFVLIGIVVLLFLLSASAFKPSATWTKLRNTSSASALSEQLDHYLWVLAPVTGWDDSMCKTTVSGAIMNYPPQYAVPWDLSTTGSPEVHREGSKLSSILSWLDKAMNRHQNDVILILDEPGNWFQLRPEVLLKRYFKITSEANRHLNQTFGGKAKGDLEIRQKVLFSAQVECPPHLMGESACTTVPESPYSTIAEGTDQYPRYLNRFAAMGAVKDVHALYKHAVEQSREAADRWSHDHSVFSRLFGQQELRRANLQSRKRDEESPNDMVDLGIGLDYGRELFLPLVSGYTKIESLDWVQHNRSRDDSTSTEETQARESHIQLSPDITDSMGPFWTVTGQYDLPSGDWGSIPLFTDTRTKNVPVLVQQLAGAHPAVHTTWWSQIWFTPHLRNLLNACVMITSAPFAIFVDDEGVERRFWSPTDVKVGFRDEDFKWVHYEQTCGAENVTREIFQDGKGEWYNPYP